MPPQAAVANLMRPRLESRLRPAGYWDVTDFLLALGGFPVRIPTINRPGWLIHGVPRGFFGRLARMGAAAQLSLLSLLGATAVLLEVL